MQRIYSGDNVKARRIFEVVGAVNLTTRDYNNNASNTSTANTTGKTSQSS